MRQGELDTEIKREKDPHIYKNKETERNTREREREMVREKIIGRHGFNESQAIVSKASRTVYVALLNSFRLVLLDFRS